MDTTGENLGPTIENNKVQMFYFMVFILIGSFFFLNFFIGVLFLKFNQAKRAELKGFTSKDLGWQDIQKLILTAEPDYETTNVPKEPWRKTFHDLVSSNSFDVFIMINIVLNMIQMSLTYETQTEGFTWFLDFTNYIFTTVFFVEACLKLIAFGKSYFNNAWQKFDFFVVSASLFDIALKVLENSSGGGFLKAGP